MSEIDTTASSVLPELESAFLDGFETPSVPSDPPSTPSATGKRKHESTRDKELWSLARPPRDNELTRNKFGQRMWYCNIARCLHKGTPTGARAREHLLKEHSIDLSPVLPAAKKKMVMTIEKSFQSQKERQTTADDVKERQILKGVLDQRRIREALIHLIVRRSLPQTITEWPEFIAFCASLNSEATEVVARSHSSIHRYIEKSFFKHRSEVRRAISKARSRIHLCTDTWTSPHRKEFQAINAHYVDEHGRLQKALIALPELHSGHSGSECAEQIMVALDTFSIEHRLGAITSDNASAMTTMTEQLESMLRIRKGVEWSATTNRLRCLGHVLNLAVQAFLFARDNEAVEYASQIAQRSRQPLYETVGQLSASEGQGWCAMPALQKLREFTTILRNLRHYNAFKTLAHGTIPMPNETRWNSWGTMINAALRLRVSVNEYIDKNDLEHVQITLHDWRVLEETSQFLEPFQEATKACEGDQTTLDQMLTSLDIIIAHFKACRARFPNNEPFLAAVTTSWFALDKYYKLTDESPMYAAALLLHPSYRKQYLEERWPKAWVKPAIDRARSIWDTNYASIEINEIKDEGRQGEPSFFQQQQSLLHRRRQDRDEFTVFINQDDIAATNAITWWLEEAQQRTFPRLSRMAIDVLSAPAMSAESERVFSLTRRTVEWHRSRLHGDTVERLECQKSWIKQGLIGANYTSDSDDDSDDGAVTTTSVRDEFDVSL